MSTAPPTLRRWLENAVADLVGAGVEQADADARWIACHVTGVGRGELEVRAATSGEALGADIVQVLDELLARRITREPLWHILGRAPFLGMELFVGPGVFSPRPETELLAHAAVTELLSMETPTGELRVCDVGAGSGAIGLAIARGVSHAMVSCVEPSREARKYLADNVERYGDSRVRVIASSASDAHTHLSPRTLDLVVSNPPYLVREVDWVDIETGTYDPDGALYAEANGLGVMADVVEFAQVALRPGGVIVVEHGITHNDEVGRLMASHGFSLISHHNDLVGRPRITRGALV